MPFTILCYTYYDPIPIGWLVSKLVSPFRRRLTSFEADHIWNAGVDKFHDISVQRNWWCYDLQAAEIITNVHKQILAHNAAFMVYVAVMLLWLLMRSPAKVENKGLSARYMWFGTSHYLHWRGGVLSWPVCSLYCTCMVFGRCLLKKFVALLCLAH